MPTTAPVRDASGGAIANGTNAVTGIAQSLTSVPANSVLYAWVFIDVNTNDTGAATAVSDNLGLTWALIAERSKHSDGGSAQNGHISVFRAKFAAGGSITVTATASGGSVTSATPISVNTEVLTGGRLTGGAPEIAFESSSTGTVKLPVSGTNHYGRYSYLRGSSVDWNAAAIPTAGTGWTTRVSARPGAPNYTAWGADAPAVAAGQDLQFTSSAPTSGTINNTILLEHLAPFTTLANSAEDGTNAAAPVAASTGSAGEEPWDTVTVTGGAGVVYSTDQAHSGTTSYKITSGASGTAFTQWNVASIGQLDRVYGRFHLYAATNNAGLAFMRLRGGGTQIIRITMDATGHLEVRNSANTVMVTFTNAIAASQWVRVEFDVTPSVAAGAVTVKLFNTASSSTATETQSLTSQALGVAYVDEVAWGQVVAAATMPTYYLDDLQLNITGLPGPVGGGPADQGVTLTGTSSASAAGQPAITTVTSVSLTGTATAAAVGQPAVGPGAVTVVLDSAPTLSAVGEPVVAGDTVTVSLTGGSSQAAVGQPAVVPGAVGVTLTGAASAAAAGAPAVAVGAVTVTATGVGSVAGVGAPAVTVGATNVSPSGVASAAAVGQPAVDVAAVVIAPVGVAATSGVGVPGVAAGAVTVTAASVASTSGFGQPVVTLGLTIAPSGIASTAGVGQPAVVAGATTVTLTGAASASGFGQPAVAAPAVPTVVLTGLSSTSGFGQPAVTVGATGISLTGAASGSAVGVPAVSGGVPAVLLAGVVSSSGFGLLTVVRVTVDYGIRAGRHQVRMTTFT